MDMLYSNLKYDLINDMIYDPAWSTMDYEELQGALPAFKDYLATSSDVGCGLARIWLTPKERDIFFRACAVHDFWYEHETLAAKAGFGVKEVDNFFYQYTARLYDEWKKKNEGKVDFTLSLRMCFYRAQRKLYRKLVKLIGEKIWGK